MVHLLADRLALRLAVAISETIARESISISYLVLPDDRYVSDNALVCNS